VFSETNDDDGPVISPVMMILLAYLEAERGERGVDWYREHRVGPMRRSLTVKVEPLPANIVPLPRRTKPSPLAVELFTAQAEAAGMLRLHCALCNGCKLARSK
jgi:hypothetical protein